MTPEDGIDGRDFEVPTLPDFPTTETLTYEVDGAPVAFRVGQIARVFDAEKQEWVFYQLFDIADGKAVWKLVGDTSELAEVARTGSYNDLLDKPATDTFGPLNITEMFDIPSVALPDISILMKDDGIGRPMIHIFGQDTSGNTAPLTITAPIGLGPLIGRSLPVIADDGSIANLAVTREDGETEGTITIPSNVDYVSAFYTVGTIAPVDGSYIITQEGIYKPFTIADTPMSNFIGNGDYVTINGISYNKGVISVLSLSEEYANSALGDYFMAKFFNLNKLIVPAFSQAKIPNYCFINNGLESINTDMLINATEIGSNGFNGSNKAKLVDLRGLANVTKLGVGLFAGSNLINEIQIGGVDWSTKAIGGTGAFFNNVPYSGTVYADSEYLAQAFKSKYGTRLPGWTTVINPAS